MALFEWVEAPVWVGWGRGAVLLFDWVEERVGVGGGEEWCVWLAGWVGGQRMVVLGAFMGGWGV